MDYNPLTKKSLFHKIVFMISDKDIQKKITDLKMLFVSRKEYEDFKKEFYKMRKNHDKDHMFLNNSVDFRFLNVIESIQLLSKELREFKKEMREFREQTNKTLDWLVGAFKKFDEEHTVLTARYLTVNKTIDNHEERIKALEN